MAAYIGAGGSGAAERLGLEIYRMAAHFGRRGVTLLCIGTDRATGDSLGPLVGEMLRGRFTGVCGVGLYGTLEEPVHAGNLSVVAEGLDRASLVIAVDACLGSVRRVGFISTGYGGLSPGAAVNKTLPTVGDIFVTGIVNAAPQDAGCAAYGDLENGGAGRALLQSTRLGLVMRMARIIAGGLCFGLRMLAYEGYFSAERHTATDSRYYTARRP